VKEPDAPMAAVNEASKVPISEPSALAMNFESTATYTPCSCMQLLYNGISISMYIITHISVYIYIYYMLYDAIYAYFFFKKCDLIGNAIPFSLDMFWVCGCNAIVQALEVFKSLGDQEQ
jgi:hypothetical protein